MPVEHLQCPSCGAPIQTTGSRDGAVCLFCGSTLQVAALAASTPALLPDELRQDTELLSRRAALEHLQRQLDEAEAQRDKASQALEEQLAAVQAARKGGCWPAGLLCVGALMLLSGLGAGEIVTLSLGILVVAASIMWTNRHRSAQQKRERAARSAHEPVIAEQNHRVEEIRARMGRVQEAIEQLVNRY